MNKLNQKKILSIFLVIVFLFGLTEFITMKIIKSRTFQFFGGIVNKVNTQEKAL